MGTNGKSLSNGPTRQLIENSVPQLLVEQAFFDKKFPYRSPRVDRYTGSSFVIYKDANVIYCITNAHVVENVLTIEVRFPFLGKSPLKAELKSYCFFRDIALIQITAETAKDHWTTLQEKVVPLELGDSLLIKPQDRVHVAGYPLGEENLQIGSGDISGFAVTGDVDLSFGPKSYFQITAPVNPGNSGGPTLDSNGRVIGINSAGILLASNIAYSIPSRNVHAVLAELFKDSFLQQPSFGIKANSNHKGLYINKVYPNSIFYGDVNYDDDLEHRKIFLLKDYYSLVKEEDKCNYYPNIIKKGDILKEVTVINSNEKFTFTLDRYGVSRLEKYNWRTFNLDDIEEFTTYGSEVTFTVLRDGQTVVATEKYEPRNISKFMIRPIFPLYEPYRYRYLLLGGMILMENQMIDEDCMGENEFFLRKIQVITLFKGTQIDSYHAVESGDELVMVNKERVFTLNDVTNALSLITNNLLIIDFEDGVHLELDYEEIVKEDKETMVKYQIK